MSKLMQCSNVFAVYMR